MNNIINFDLVAVCSMRAPARTQNNHSKGHQWWARDVYHLRADSQKTRCGIDCSEWLVIGPIDEIDYNCCQRCASRVATQPPEHPC